MTNTPTSIVIVSPVHNRCALTQQCLRSLAAINSEGLTVHIILVDDGSTDGTRSAIEREFPAVQLVAGDGTLYFTAGANLGFKAALVHKPDYILLINDDTYFDTDFLRYLVECAETHPRSAVGGLLLRWDEPHRVFQVDPRWDTWYGGWRHQTQLTIETVPEEAFRVATLAGNCVLFPTRVFAELGFMDEVRFPNFGDSTFTARLRKNGWQLWVEPRARVYNQPNSFPKTLRSMSWPNRYQALWGDLRSYHNLRGRFMLYWVTAPTRFQAVVAFGIFFGRLILRGIGVTKNWP